MNRFQNFTHDKQSIWISLGSCFPLIFHQISATIWLIPKPNYFSLNPQTIKLRVYPNKAQEQELFLSFKARQFAYHMGIDLYAKDSREFFRLKPSEEFLAASRIKSLQAIRLPYKPKRRSSAFLSQQLTVLLNEIRRFEKRAADLAKAFGSAVESHPQVWLLAVPRCVFSQGFIDYQKALSEAFASLKSGKSSKVGKTASEKSGKTNTKKSLPEKFTRKANSSTQSNSSSESFSLVRRFPTFYSLYDQQTARFQIDKPATNKKHIASWESGKIRLGDLVLQYKDPTKLPVKLPSLVTVTRNQVGQYFASFLSEESRQYKSEVRQEKLAVRHNNRASEISQARLENRALGCDPNIRAEYFADTTGVVFSIAENQAIKNSQARLEEKQLAAARHLARTRRYARSTQTPASSRHRKARQVLAKVHNDRKNQHEDFIQKKTSVLATYYPRQARESLVVAKMIQENGSKEAVIKGLSGAQAKRYGVSRGMSRATFGRQRVLLEQKLEAFHPGSDASNSLAGNPVTGELITLKKYERSTQCCSKCYEERFTIPRSAKGWVCPYCKNEHHRDACAGENVCAKGFGLAPLGASKSKTPLTKTEITSFLSQGLKIDPKTGFPVVQVKDFTGAGQRRKRFVSVKFNDIAPGDRFELRLLRRLLRFSEVQLSQGDLKRLHLRA